MSENVAATNKAKEITVKHTVDRQCCAIWQADDVIIVDRLQARELVQQILLHLGMATAADLDPSLRGNLKIDPAA